METYSQIIPTMQYADAKKAIDWLCKALGFKEHAVFTDEDGTIIHSQLIYKNSMIMIGATAKEGEYSDELKQPLDIGGFETQSPYVIVDENEIDSHYETAVGHGAKIVIKLKTEDYGGKSYSCKDPEGHLWNFGSYNPWGKG